MKLTKMNRKSLCSARIIYYSRIVAICLYAILIVAAVAMLNIAFSYTFEYITVFSPGQARELTESAISLFIILVFAFNKILNKSAKDINHLADLLRISQCELVLDYIKMRVKRK